MKRQIAIEGTVFAALVGLCVAVRTTESVANFAPVAAAALFGGFFFTRRWLALALPLAAMLISDFFIGAYSPGVMICVYAALILPVACRPWLKSSLSAGRVATCTVGCSIAFFLLTNAGHWFFTTMYPKSMGGLIECYGMAIPFLRNTLVGNVFWSAMLFGGYVLIARNSTQPARTSRELAAAVG